MTPKTFYRTYFSKFATNHIIFKWNSLLGTHFIEHYYFTLRRTLWRYYQVLKNLFYVESIFIYWRYMAFLSKNVYFLRICIYSFCHIIFRNWAVFPKCPIMMVSTVTKYLLNLSIILNFLIPNLLFYFAIFLYNERDGMSLIIYVTNWYIK